MIEIRCCCTARFFSYSFGAFICVRVCFFQVALYTHGFLTGLAALALADAQTYSLTLTVIVFVVALFEYWSALKFVLYSIRLVFIVPEKHSSFMSVLFEISLSSDRAFSRSLQSQSKSFTTLTNKAKQKKLNLIHKRLASTRVFCSDYSENI